MSKIIMSNNRSENFSFNCILIRLFNFIPLSWENLIIKTIANSKGVITQICIVHDYSIHHLRRY